MWIVRCNKRRVLQVVGVPKGKKLTWEILSRAGYVFEDKGPLYYVIEKVSGRPRADIETVTYEELLSRMPNPEALKHTWVVCYVEHVQTPFVYSPRIVITDVPDDKTKKDVKRFIEVKGLTPYDYKMAWANYCLVRLDEAPAIVIAKVRKQYYDKVIKFEEV